MSDCYPTKVRRYERRSTREYIRRSSSSSSLVHSLPVLHQKIPPDLTMIVPGFVYNINLVLLVPLRSPIVFGYDGELMNLSWLAATDTCFQAR